MNIIKHNSTVLMLAAACAMLPAAINARVLPQEMMDYLTQQADAFIRAPGFTETDIDQACNPDDFYTPQRFPQQGSSAFRPDADLGPIARAVLLVDCAEGPLPHPRYRISYHLARAPGASDVQRTYIDIARFNLGPTRYQDIIQYVDQAFWPPEDIFGTGPHLSWRFVVGSIQGNRSHIEHASRKTLSPTQAAALDCLGVPCLSLSNPTGPSGSWGAVTPPALDAAAYREPGSPDAPGPARVAQELYLYATGGGSAEPSESASFEKPEMLFVISKDIEGQDSGTSGLLHQQGIMDDAVSAIWIQRQQMAQSDADWHQLVIYRPGRN